MAIKGRTAFRLGVVVIGLAALGWKHFHPPTSVAAEETTQATAPVDHPSTPVIPEKWKLGALTLTPCELGQPNSGLSTAAWCAPFEVPENRDDPNSRKIKLKIGRAHV